MTRTHVLLRKQLKTSLLVALALVVGLVSAEASFPGLNGKIIFTSRRNMNTLNLFTMMPDGSNQTNIQMGLTPEFFPNYSSDGTQIAFVRDVFPNNKIFKMNEDTTGQVLLKGPALNSVPVWSPSGAFIAFEDSRAGNGDIWIMLSAPSPLEIQLTTNPADEFDPAWSPDGNRIAFTRGLGGSNQEIVIRQLFPPMESVISNSAMDDRAASWSPDGTQIAFVSNRGGGDFDVYVMNDDGSNVYQVTTDLGFDNIPVWSPDRTLIAFTSNRLSPSDVYVRNSDGSGPVTRLTVTGDNGQPEWQAIPPASATAAIQTSVADLVAMGSLNKGNGNALDKKLENAIKKMEQLNLQASVNKLQAFINQVNAFLNSGKLTPAEAQPLIDDAQLVIDYINANGLPAPVAPEIDLP